ncbi:hypothetical protein [Tenacibaculum agarivorans]|uniref:hypothetical protein n=1 Tax=Tenacibaculum agarivorans TaxID=1908389 RepID=UPI00094BAE8F|nr:hypothetical protein [Tenacibaculum agarivorans]
MTFSIKNIILTLVFVITLIGCESFFEEDISDEKVLVLAPVDGVTVDAGTIKFSWEAISGTDEYKFQVATPTFSTATQIVEDTNITETSISIKLEKGEYEWRVKAMNTEHETPFTTYKITIN